MKAKFKVGDKVKVIDDRKRYTMYADFFEGNDVNINIAARYCYGEDVNCDRDYKVLFIGKHLHFKGEEPIAVIEALHNHKVYLIGVDGLKKC